MENNIYLKALLYKKSGLEVIPNHPVYKYPKGVENWQTKEFSESELREYIVNKGWNVGIRNIEGLDFDNNGSPSAITLLKEFRNILKDISPNLFERLVVEETKSGGFHVAWGCEFVGENQKLASRPPTTKELKDNPKAPIQVLIETRGKGGQFVVSPSRGYRIMQGDWSKLSTISKEQRELIINTAKSFNKVPSSEVDNIRANTAEGDVRPGDHFNEVGGSYAYECLLKHDWKAVRRRGDVVYMVRPGKKVKDGISATYGHVGKNVLYVFSSNAGVFESGHAYSPFAVVTFLEYGGDFSKSASWISKKYMFKSTKDVKVNPSKSKPDDPDISIPIIKPEIAFEPPIDNKRFLGRSYPAKKWLVKGFIRATGITLIQGDGGVGKTSLVYSLIKAVTSSGIWLDTYETAIVKVLLLDRENEDIDIQTSLFAQGATSENIFHYNMKQPFFDKQGLTSESKFLSNWVIKEGIGAVVLDSLVDFYVGIENDANEAAKNTLVWKEIFRDCVVIPIHHEAKPTAGFKTKAKHRGRGSSHLFNSAQSVISVSILDEENAPERILIEHSKVRGARKKKPFEVEMVIEADVRNEGETVITGFKYLGVVDLDLKVVEQAETAVLKLLKSNPLQKFSAVNMREHISHVESQQIEKALVEVKRKNIVCYERSGRRFVYWHLDDEKDPEKFIEMLGKRGKNDEL